MGRRSCAALFSLAAILALSTQQYASLLTAQSRTDSYAAGDDGGVPRTVEGGQQHRNVDPERRRQAAANESESDSSPAHSGAVEKGDDLLPPPLAIAVPTTRDGMCKYADALARVSLNRQTSRPSRVILGISLGSCPPRTWCANPTAEALSPSELECIERFRSNLDVPLTVATSNETASPGSSRNAALSALLPGEAVLMHDDDEYVHPHAVEFVRWTLARYPNTDALIMGLVLGFGHVGYTNSSVGKSDWPWCQYTRPEDRFLSVYTTTRVFKNPRGSNVHIEDPDAPPKPCGGICHGYVALRRRPANDFGIRYPNSKRRNEDGTFVQMLLDRNATVRYSCFPIVAYRSVIPDGGGPVVDDPRACLCYGGFAVCLGKLTAGLLKSQVKGLSRRPG